MAKRAGELKARELQSELEQMGVRLESLTAAVASSEAKERKLAQRAEQLLGEKNAMARETAAFRAEALSSRERAAMLEQAPRPTLAFSRLLPPSLTFPRLCPPSPAFARLRSPSLAPRSCSPSAPSTCRVCRRWRRSARSNLARTTLNGSERWAEP